MIEVLQGDCREVMAGMEPGGFDAVGIELDEHWCEVSRQRVADELGLFAEVE
jgi:hypothetical protein